MPAPHVHGPSSPTPSRTLVAAARTDASTAAWADFFTKYIQPKSSARPKTPDMVRRDRATIGNTWPFDLLPCLFRFMPHGLSKKLPENMHHLITKHILVL